MSNYILAIDQGTSSSRSFIFDLQGNILAHAHQDVPMHYPQDGFIEQDPNVIWESILNTIQDAIAKANINIQDIAGIGITNQRETTVLWDKNTGKPIYHAINWQDRRTTKLCKELDSALGTYIFQNTGLVVDPYFSATKIKWILHNVDGAMQKAQNRELCFGTIDSYLIWKLTNGRAHVTDLTNASRTMLLNLQQGEWDDTILDHLNIPKSLLPNLVDSVGEFGITDSDVIGASIPILGVAGDQQAAMVGQNCLNQNDAKLTFGTGCFALVNTGNNIVYSRHNLISTYAYTVDNKSTYALEGSVFIAGALVQWLRDNLQLFNQSTETAQLAATSKDDGVIFVPALTGMGAPHWEPLAKGALFGITRDTSSADITKAALEGIVFQTIDLLKAMNADLSTPLKGIRVDGGMANNDWFLQRLADFSGCVVTRARSIESSIVGAAWLAHLGLEKQTELSENQFWQPQKEFVPEPKEQFEIKYRKWQQAVDCVKQFSRVQA